MLLGRKCAGTAVTPYDVNGTGKSEPTHESTANEAERPEQCGTSHNSLWKHILRIIVQLKSHLPLSFSPLFPLLQDNGMQHWKTGSANPVRSCGPVDRQQRQPQNQRRTPREL